MRACVCGDVYTKVLRNDRLIVTNLVTVTGYIPYIYARYGNLVFYNYNTTHDLSNYRAKIEILFAHIGIY